MGLTKRFFAGPHQRGGWPSTDTTLTRQTKSEIKFLLFRFAVGNRNKDRETLHRRRREMVEACLKLLEVGYYEVQFAFEGLADENVWERPAEGLLSVGELAGHL